jgi:hypothetical protein
MQHTFDPHPSYDAAMMPIQQPRFKQAVVNFQQKMDAKLRRFEYLRSGPQMHDLK